MIQDVNVGTLPNDGTGDLLRDAFIILNNNIQELVDKDTLLDSDISSINTLLGSLQTQINGKAPLVHSHIISDITGLQTILDGKVDETAYISDIATINTSINNILTTLSGLGAVATSNDYADLDGIPSTFTPSTHTHVEADITDLDKYTQLEVDNLLNDKFDNPTGNNTQYLDGAGVPTTFPTIPSVTGFVPYTGANQDVDLGNNNLNAKGLKVNGTGGTGHLGLKHQSINATAGGQETALFAGNDGELYYKNDGLTLQQIASRAWVNSLGFITNVITALGFTPENVANKSTSVTTDQASNTKYPSVKSVFDWVVGLGYQTSSQVNTLISTALATFKTANFLDATSSIQGQLNGKQSIAEVVSANKTAVNDMSYVVTATCTFTDPTPAEGKGYDVFVRNGVATIGGVAYSEGTEITRIYHSGSWKSYAEGEWVDFSGSSTITSWATPSVTFLQYMLKGNSLTIRGRITGTSNSSSNPTITIPYTLASLGSGQGDLSLLYVNNGISSPTPGAIVGTDNTNTIQFFRDGTFALAWTASGTKTIAFLTTFIIQRP